MVDRMTEPVLLRSIDKGVLLLRFNRPERNNGWNMELEEAYFGALARRGQGSRGTSHRGDGRGSFFLSGPRHAGAVGGSRGQPGSHRRATADDVRPPHTQAGDRRDQRGLRGDRTDPGECRRHPFRGTAAKFTAAFARRGLPAENSLSWLLPRIVGTGKAMDLLLSSRVFLADEAHAIGLVDRLCEPADLLRQTLDYAEDMALNCSPRSMAAIKRQVQDDWERTAEESRQGAIQLVVELTKEADFVEGVRSFTEKRSPAFEGIAVDVADY